MPYADKKREKAAKHANYLANSEAFKVRTLARRKAVKEWIDKLKAVSKCSQCPENHPACLQFHHLDRRLKIKSINHMAHNASLKSVQAEIAKCIILCSNCHFKLHWDEVH